MGTNLMRFRFESRNRLHDGRTNKASVLDSRLIIGAAEDLLSISRACLMKIADASRNWGVKLDRMSILMPIN